MSDQERHSPQPSNSRTAAADQKPGNPPNQPMQQKPQTPIQQPESSHEE
jgi:hypothetical protein